MTKFLSVMFAGAAIVGLALMGSGDARAQSGEVWKVEIDMYSGRPNPTFTLTAAEVTELKARMGKAPAMAAAAMPDKSIRPSKLGYRGIIVSGKAGTQVLEDTEVSKGKIFRKAGTKALMDDSAAGLERYLAGLAVSKGAVSAETGQWLMAKIP